MTSKRRCINVDAKNMTLQYVVYTVIKCIVILLKLDFGSPGNRLAALIGPRVSLDFIHKFL